MRSTWMVLLFITLAYSSFVSSDAPSFDIEKQCYNVSPENQFLTSNVGEIGCYQKLIMMRDFIH